MENKANQRTEIIKNQIDKFDSKANILIAIVGIIFAVSLSVIDVFNELNSMAETEQTKIKFGLLLTFCIIYFVSFAAEMFLLIGVIFPRKKKNTSKIDMSYYFDVANLSADEIKQHLIKDTEDPAIIQLSTNAKICVKKHKFLEAAIWTMIPMFISIFAMFFIAILM